MNNIILTGLLINSYNEILSKRGWKLLIKNEENYLAEIVEELIIEYEKN